MINSNLIEHQKLIDIEFIVKERGNPSGKFLKEPSRYGRLLKWILGTYAFW